MQLCHNGHVDAQVANQLQMIERGSAVNTDS